MNWEFDSSFLARLRMLSRALVGLALFVSLVGLWGGSVAPGLLLACLMLLLPSASRMGRVLAGGVMLLGALYLAQPWLTFLPRIGFHGDAHPEGGQFGWLAGRLTTSAALCLLLIGLGGQAGKRYAFGQLMAYFSLLLSYLALAGHLFGAASFTQGVHHLFIPLQTALALGCLSMALLLRHPDQGLTRVLSSSHAGSRHARVAFTGMFLTPVLLGALITKLSRTFGYPLELSLLLFCGSFLMSSVTAAYFNFQKLNRSDARWRGLIRENEGINQQLGQLNEELHAATEELSVTNEQLTSAHQSIQSLMETRLQHSEVKFQELTESITEQFFAVDPQLRFVYWNSACERLTGIPASAMIGSSIYEQYPAFKGGKTDATLQQVLKSGRPVCYEYHNRHRQQDFEVNIFPSRIGLTVLVKDITETKRKHQELMALNGQLTERNFELDQIVYKISHDIRSPLTSVLGLLNIIRETPLENPLDEYVLLMENRILKLDRFTQSMLDFSRNTRTGLHWEPIDFGQLISESRQELEYLPGFPRMAFRVSLQGEVLHSDPFRLKIILTNLMGNAIKYQSFGREDAYLEIAVVVTREHARLTFQDNGIGIEPAYQARLFEMFFRATAQGEGSGLGLYIVKQTVEKLYGSIQLESIPREGSCFSLRIPNQVGSGVAGQAGRTTETVQIG